MSPPYKIDSVVSLIQIYNVVSEHRVTVKELVIGVDSVELNSWKFETAKKRSVSDEQWIYSFH